MYTHVVDTWARECRNRDYTKANVCAIGVHRPFSLVWNRKLGKEPKQEDSYGKLWCRLCGRTFAWHYRHNNLPKTVCRPLDDKPCPPEWVTTMTAADVNQDMAMHGLSVSTKFARARQGIG